MCTTSACTCEQRACTKRSFEHQFDRVDVDNRVDGRGSVCVGAQGPLVDVKLLLCAIGEPQRMRRSKLSARVCPSAEPGGNPPRISRHLPVSLHGVCVCKRPGSMSSRVENRAVPDPLLCLRGWRMTRVARVIALRRSQQGLTGQRSQAFHLHRQADLGSHRWANVGAGRRAQGGCGMFKPDHRAPEG